MNTNHQRQRRNTNSDSARRNGIINSIVDNDENNTNNQPQVPSFHQNGNETTIS